MVRLGRPIVVALVAGLLLSGAACSSDGDKGKKPAPRKSASARPAPSASATTFDPPRTFDAARAAALPREASAAKISVGGVNFEPLPVALWESTAFVASVDSVQAVDTATGRVTETIRPTDAAPADQPPVYATVGTNPSRPPIVLELAGKPTVVAPLLVKVPDQGTTRGGSAIDVVAIEAADPRRYTFTRVPVPADVCAEPRGLAAVGADAGTAVVTLDCGSNGYTAAVEPAGKRVVWTKAGFVAGAVTGGVAVGRLLAQSGADLRAAGLAVVDGKQRWADKTNSSALTIQPAGAGKAILNGTNYSDGKPAFRLVIAADGKAVPVAGGDFSLVTCFDDGAGIAVCARQKSWAGGLDLNTGKWLWQISATETPGRVPPVVRSAWHGAVYATTDGGPVVLDARTGQDRELRPGAAPYVVNGRVGIAEKPGSTSGGVWAMPATG